MRAAPNILRRWVGNQKGVAVLLEVVVATLLLSLAIVPIFYGMTAVMLSVDDSLVTTAATNILRHRTETLKTLGYSGVPVGGPDTITIYSGFDLVQTVAPVPDMVNTLGESVVKKVTLVIYRHPKEANPTPITRWEFLLYAVNGL